VTRRILTAAATAAAIAAVAPSAAGAATHTVFVGGDEVVKTAPTNFSPNAFLRKTVTVHVGDTVRWPFRGFHTVTFPVKGKQPPPFEVPTPTPVSGAIDGAGRPFWFNGQLPQLAVNPVAAAPTKGSAYTGTRFRNSGLPATPPKAYSLKFTKTGTFDYYCAIHTGMEGRVRVLSSKKRIPTEAQNRAAATAELNRLVAQAKSAAAKPTAAGTVDIGRGPSGTRFTINSFFPNNPTVKVGGTLTFTMAGQNPTEIHTATLGPLTREQVPFIGANGAISAVAAYPSDPPTAFPPYIGTNHGNGFLNLGLKDNRPASPLTNSGAITFNAAGTFQLKCLVHAGMDATVTVTP
jgi:plastocyanin